jgi:DNA modification methylase
VETKKLDELIGNKKNPRTMSKHDADALKKSINEFGDLSGIVFNVQTNQLVGGHQRIETFKRLTGERNVVITQRFETANRVGTVAVGYITYNGEFYGYREVDWPLDRETAANIAANRIQGEFDLDLLAEMDWWLKENNPDMLALTGQTDEEISRLLDAAGPSIKEDEAPEVDESVPAISKLGEVYQLGRHRLMCGSATEAGDVALLMNGDKADMVFTDPPYGYSYESNHQKKHKVLENDDTMLDFLPSVLAYTNENSAVYVCGSFQTIADWIIYVKQNELKLKNLIVWKKNNWSMGDLKAAYGGQHELIIYANKGKSELRQGRDRDVWEFDREPPTVHPTMKPIELVSRAIKNSSNSKGKILDVFGGSGSTLIACEQTDRTCYMLELDEKYIDVIRKRWAKFVYPERWENEWETLTPKIEVSV